MKIFKFLSIMLMFSFLLSSCFKENDDNLEPDNDQPIESVDDLQISSDFDWKTQQTVQVFVNIPVDGEIQPLIITNRDKTKRYFKGYPEGNSRTVSTKITIPSYVRGLRLIYNGAPGPNYEYISNGSLVYNFNDMRKSVMDDECDLNGFVTYSKGGWTTTAQGNNPGSLRDQHFDDIYPNGLVIGDPDNYTITFEESVDVNNYKKGGKPAVLDQSYTNPTKKLGNLADQILAARLNRDYSEAGVLGDNDDYSLGELIYVEGPFQGYTVNEMLDLAEVALGGGDLGEFSVEDYKNAAEDVVNSFHEGNNANILTCPYDEDEEEQDPFVEVDATCVDGDVIFTISNTGDGDMDDDYNYSISKNGGMIESDDYELDASQTVDFSFTGYDTDEFEIEVETPRGETLTETITGCGEEEDDGNGGGDDDENITEDFQGTLAYEDLWPGKGDYDFNDLVIDYDFEINKNNQEIVQSITATFTIKAFGAAQHNGFGFTIPTLVPGDIASVEGYDIDGNSVFDMAGNGIEQNQSLATFIVFDDVRRVMPQTTPGVGVNTELEQDFIDPVTIQLEIDLSSNAITFNDLDIGSFNPFIIVNSVTDGSPGERGREVHLPGYEPTDLFDDTWLGQQEDASEPGEGTYFVTDKNLPWAINIAEGFDWIIEYQDITGAYLYFAEWAQSNGINYPDWYVDQNDYRNDELIYPTQINE